MAPKYDEILIKPSSLSYEPSTFPDFQYPFLDNRAHICGLGFGASFFSKIA